MTHTSRRSSFESEEEPEDLSSFVAETDAGKKSSGDSKGTRSFAVVSKVSSREEKKYGVRATLPVPKNSEVSNNMGSIIHDYNYFEENYIDLKHEERKSLRQTNASQLFDNGPRDSYSVYSGLRATFVGGMKFDSMIPMSLDERAQSIAVSTYGDRLRTATNDQRD